MQAIFDIVLFNLSIGGEGFMVEWSCLPSKLIQKTLEDVNPFGSIKSSPAPFVYQQEIIISNYIFP